MTAVKTHLARHWHHHLALWASAAAIALLLTAGGAAIITGLGRGGYKQAPLPPLAHIRGGPLPASWSLARFSVRIHDQGNSSSCVGQTLATIEEITWAERHHRWPFSSGFIYDQANGGVDGGTSYQAAYGVLLTQGDAGLSIFPHDGQDWWV